MYKLLILMTLVTSTSQAQTNNYIIVVPPYRPIRTIPANRGMHAIPNRKYVSRIASRGGGGFRFQTHGSPGKIQENPFYVLSKERPDVPKRDELKAFYDLLERKFK